MCQQILLLSFKSKSCYHTDLNKLFAHYTLYIIYIANNKHIQTLNLLCIKLYSYVVVKNHANLLCTIPCVAHTLYEFLFRISFASTCILFITPFWANAHLSVVIGYIATIIKARTNSMALCKMHFEAMIKPPSTRVYLSAVS